MTKVMVRKRELMSPDPIYLPVFSTCVLVLSSPAGLLSKLKPFARGFTSSVEQTGEQTNKLTSRREGQGRDARASLFVYF